MPDQEKHIPSVETATIDQEIEEPPAAPNAGLLAEHPSLDAHTPMGGTIVPGGATFRVWAPRARDIYLLCQANGWQQQQPWRLTRWNDETWVGFASGLRHGDEYKFYVYGPAPDITGDSKRDPYARELSTIPAWPNSNCVLYDPARFPWHDRDFQPPAFNDLVIYQLHLGTWYKPDLRPHSGFLDVIDRIDYLLALGVNAIQPLPVVEFAGAFSLGYNGTDYFSPENDYAIYDPELISSFVGRLNDLLARAGQTGRQYTAADLTGSANQLRAMIDLCHVHGIAVIMDVVYNHAGGFTGDDQSMYFFDRATSGDNNNSLYFTNEGYAGGLVFAYWNCHVRQFLIDNARFCVSECRGDGLRYDQVSVIRDRGGTDGQQFCRDLTDTIHFVKPQAVQIAENWPVDTTIVRPTNQGGYGFDCFLNDGLREAIRAAIRQASGGMNARLDMDRLAMAIENAPLLEKWRAVNYIENHDIVREGSADAQPRIPELADSSNPRSWYATSRARVALGLLLTAPGIPHLFMGQEFLENKKWSDNPQSPNMLYWTGLFDANAPGHRQMADYLRFTQDLIALHRSLPGLRADGVNVFYRHNDDRVIAFHRWISGIGDDVVVIANLAEHTWDGYRLGFPEGGYWKETFNSDAYENYVNPNTIGNGGRVIADGPGMHGMPSSATVTIPANSILVFAR